MTGGEARERFDEAFEGELDPEAQRAFDAALAGDPELRAEWEAFVGTMREVRALSLGASPSPDEAASLAQGVERKLRVRSRGRFYRDRYASASRRERLVPVWIAVIALLLVLVAWVGQRLVGVTQVEPEPAAQTPPR